ncbi:hypothetical protein BDZ94DRAFT_1255052 [Collybia nuda]|uniref:Flavin reductase like domain-containing protein n=1 Tax=Collybia nuda TaxID=64659 RepID=A0A9P6CLK4_9AGAR|nr:hypothetical protein BDZ94DRAFT_1255052 [Collybia nuda]
MLPRSGKRIQTLFTQFRFIRATPATMTKAPTVTQALPPMDPNISLSFTQPPLPAWKMGDGVANKAWAQGGGHDRKTWDMATTSPKDTYQLLTSAIVPRPIAFVSSLSTDGVPNLAPFSYFSMVSHHPPLISVSFRLSPARPKDTRENVLATKQFTVNIISENFVEAANAASTEAPADVNEWIVSGLTMAPSTDVKPAYVEESAASFECELYSYQDITPLNSTNVTTTMILGLIKRVHIRKSVLREDGNQIDPAKLRPIARLGSTTYSRLLNAFDLPRLPWNATTQDEYSVLQEKAK